MPACRCGSGMKVFRSRTEQMARKLAEKLAYMTVNEFVALYVDTGIQQYKALDNFDTRRFNRLFPIMRAVEAELKSGDRDQRSALLPLHSHRNLQVRVNVAKATPDRAGTGAPTIAGDTRNEMEPSKLGRRRSPLGFGTRNMETGVRYRPARPFKTPRRARPDKPPRRGSRCGRGWRFCAGSGRIWR